MKTSETISKVAGALLKVQSEMKNVIKDSKNPFFKSNYADINALREELLPLLSANNLIVMQPPTVFEGKNYIETIVIHTESGEFISSLNEVVVAKQNDPQAYLASQTYTRRGALQATFCMGAVDDDGNFASGKTEKQETFKKEVKAGIIVDTPPKKTAEQAKTDAVKTSSFAKKAVEKKEVSGDLDL